MDGILAIDKMKGCTSRDVCDIVLKLTRVKCGHSGTLDPAATGLLLIGVGKGVKILGMISNLPKTYRFTVHFGKETDTLDATGAVIKEADCNFSETELNETIKSFEGIIEQEAPKYSAHKLGGKRLYKMARENIEVKPPTKKVRVYYIKLLSFDRPFAEMEVKCSKGTYVRSIARDIAYKLNTVAHASEVRRTNTGEFSVSTAIKQEEITEETLKANIMTIDEALYFLPVTNITEDQYGRFINGNTVYLSQTAEYSRVFCEKRFIGIAQKVDNRSIKPHKVLFH